MLGFQCIVLFGLITIPSFGIGTLCTQMPLRSSGPAWPTLSASQPLTLHFFLALTSTFGHFLGDLKPLLLCPLLCHQNTVDATLRSSVIPGSMSTLMVALPWFLLHPIDPSLLLILLLLTCVATSQVLFELCPNQLLLLLFLCLLVLCPLMILCHLMVLSPRLLCPSILTCSLL